MSEIALEGIDGANPLGFLAAVGTLVTAHAAGENAARLRWTRGHTWVPLIEGLRDDDSDALCATLAAELRGQPVDSAADEARRAAKKAFDEIGTRIKKKVQELKKRGLARDEFRSAREEELAPLEVEQEERHRAWLHALRDAVPRPELALGEKIDCTPVDYRAHATLLLRNARHAERDPLDFLVAFGSDGCVTRGESIEPTPFCFITGSGHQYFLDTARQLMAKANARRVRKAIFCPWTYRDPGLSMRWDPVEDKRYALTDVRPADQGASTVWMANLLAYRGLVLFSCAPTRRGLEATAWCPETKDREDRSRPFTWPLWEFPASPDLVRSLLQLPALCEEEPLDRGMLRARGVSACFRARRIAVGTGTNRKVNFTPARAVL